MGSYSNTRKLSPKEKRFVSEYMKDQNGTQAAIRAGYSKISARTTAARMLAKDNIKAAFEVGLKRVEDKALVSVVFVLEGLKEVAKRCMQHVPVMEFDTVKKQMVQKEGLDPKTGEMVGLYEFDSSGANRSLELIGKHLRMFTELREHSGPHGEPIKTEVMARTESRLTEESVDRLLQLADEMLIQTVTAIDAPK